MKDDVDRCAVAVTPAIISAASTCIPKSTVNGKKNDECNNAIKEINHPFRILRW